MAAAGLIDDGAYASELDRRLRQRYGTDSRWVWFRDVPVTTLRVGDATHANQDVCRPDAVQAMVADPALGFDASTTGVPLLIRDGDRTMVWDGHHRYAAAVLRGDRTIRVRLLALVIGWLCLALAGCAAPAPWPERPHIEWYVNPRPMEVPGPVVYRPGLRPVVGPKIAAPICITDADQLRLEEYLDRIDKLRR